MTRPKTCIHPGCTALRWSGPNGDKLNFFARCEAHQHELWRNEAKKAKEKKREAKNGDGQPRRRGRKPANGGGGNATDNQSVAAPVVAGATAGHKPMKVLVLDYNTRQMTHIEGYVVLETSLPEDALAADLLLEGYGEYVVMQRGENLPPLMMAYEGK